MKKIKNMTQSVATKAMKPLERTATALQIALTAMKESLGAYYEARWDMSKMYDGMWEIRNELEKVNTKLKEYKQVVKEANRTYQKQFNQAYGKKT